MPREKESNVKTAIIEGIGVAVSSPDGDWIEFDDHEQANSISAALEAAGAETVDSHLEHALRTIGGKHYDNTLYSRSNKQDVEHYRAESGRQYPRVYRIKVVAEVEELPDDECEAFWVRHRYHQPDDSNGEVVAVRKEPPRDE